MLLAEEGQPAIMAAPDYLMIKSIGIKNFRGFSSLDVEGLRRINIVVGPNASGKTAFLEAIYLASGGSSQLALKLRLFRGLSTEFEVSLPELNPLWADLFYCFDLRRPVSISLRASDGNDRVLAITRAESLSLTLPLNGDIVDRPKESTLLRFAWRSGDNEPFIDSPEITVDGLRVRSDPKPSKVAFFPSAVTTNPEEGAKILADLIKGGQKAQILDYLNSVFPLVQDIMPLTNAGKWVLHVQVDQRVLPLSMYSAGASRLALVILQMANLEQGAILIDEIENGLYYKTLPDVWRSLAALCRQYQTQLFVTTHSLECLRAGAGALREHADDFALIRFNRDGNVAVVEGSRVEDALAEGFEVR